MLIKADKIKYTKVNGQSSEGYVVAVVVSEDNVSINQDDSMFFSITEINHIKMLKSHKMRYSFLLGRFAAKYAVKEYVAISQNKDVAFNMIEIGSNINGKPIVFLDKKTTALAITVSHTDESVIALVGNEAFCFGVDCESNKSKNQMQLINWTQKEALGKFLGIGICARNNTYNSDIINIENELIEAHYNNFIDIYVYTACLKEYTISLAYHRKMEKCGVLNIFKLMACYLDNVTQ